MAKNRPISPHYVMKKLKHEYYGGICCCCDKLPDYKFTYQYDGVRLVEHYCQDHFDKII